MVSVKCHGCGDQYYVAITNGTFASGSNSWTLTGSFQADSRFTNCFSCPGYAYLANSDGTGGNNLTGTMSQSIYIPTNVITAWFGYYYRITTTDSTTNAHDHLTLNLILPGGTVVGLDDLSNLDANSTYAVRGPFELGQYKGQTVTIRFTGTTDSNGPTVFCIDDVSVWVLAPAPVTPLFFGVGGPTIIPEGTTAQYNAVVVNCDGSVQSVTPTWGENSSATTISASGLLTAGSVSSDTPVIITANTINYPITVVHIVPIFIETRIIE